MIFPSHQNSANERAARRANHKANLRKEVLRETATSALVATFAKHGQKMCDAGLVSTTGNQTFIKAGKRHYTAYKIGGKFSCECRDNEKYGTCAHVSAAQTFNENQAEKSNVLSFPKTMPTEEKPEDSNRIAANQALAVALLFANETTGGGVWRAFEKAERELKENETIEFTNGVLTFVSRGSRMFYAIDEQGCSTNCKAFASGTFCYHRALFAILECRARLIADAENSPAVRLAA